ncbi:MAG: transglycosylase domain-containing protein [Parvularculaceae bacterium]
MARKTPPRREPTFGKARKPRKTTPSATRKPAAGSSLLSKAARLTERAVQAAFGFAALGVIIGGALAVYYLADLPDASQIWDVRTRPAITLLDRHGEEIAVIGLEHAQPVRLRDLPPHVPNAVIAAEDRNFMHHIGVNPVSVLRALFVNLREGEIEQGGSTITQQLAKNLYLSPDKTLKRKIQELVLALQLEARFTKDQILTLYLNRVYFGGGAYGIEAAARVYFGKPAAELTIGEAAVLAGLLKAPSRYTPRVRPEDAAARGTYVLDAMAEIGAITMRQRREAAAEPVILAPKAATDNVFYFVDSVLRDIAARIGRIEDDIRVRTTLDLAAQRAAEAAAASAPGDAQAALVMLDATGGVRAMVGGRSYSASQFNRATQARRQPGSAFKPFVYLAALEAGWTPDETILDAPVSVGGWAPGNFNDRYYGEVDLGFALSRSLNSAAVRVSERIGRRRVADAARRLGIVSPPSVTPSLALGASEVTLLELTSAYAPFANGGFRAVPHFITRVETRDGAALYERRLGLAEPVMSPSAHDAITGMLARVVREGTGRRAALAEGGKTGTSQAHRDAWFVGYAGGYIAGVWFGHDDNRPMEGVTGGSLPAETWQAFMSGLDLSAEDAPSIEELFPAAPPRADGD